MNEKTTSEVKLDKINQVNEKFYVNDVNHTITFAISNAINPTFSVYASNLQDALDELAEYLVDHELYSLYFTHDELFNNENEDDNVPEEETDSYHQAGNGIYFDMTRIHAEVEEINNEDNE